ncbi:MAG: hypothetical protein UD936_09020 [Acutalibacteraceae bacterium]|nr:hypothetical protein [Acutalibacteraceae bacterium]
MSENQNKKKISLSDIPDIIMKTVCIAVCIFGFWVMIDGMQNDCIEAGCNSGADFGESYCGYHKYRNERDEEEAQEAYMQRAEQARIDYYRERNSYNNSSSYNSSSSSYYSSSDYDDSYYYESPYESYDDGYEDMYYNGDYDSERYYNDDEYAEGVDDAMYDLDEEGEPDC